MNWLMLVPLVVKLISIAEAYIVGEKSGAQKKEFVSEALKTVVVTTTQLSTGGQKETWEAIAPDVSKVIDSTVSILFPSKAENIETLQPSG